MIRWLYRFCTAPLRRRAAIKAAERIMREKARRDAFDARVDAAMAPIQERLMEEMRKELDGLANRISDKDDFLMQSIPIGRKYMCLCIDARRRIIRSMGRRW